ncbi:MAG: hypothetical protein LBJ47_05840 [Tannerella sp.]|jgi:uncharacterized membrane protein YvbJ|nr:hypothetical protein [Tannerella sp.]
MEVKKCPFCGKTVLAIAKVCKHCGKSFEQTNAENPQQQVTAQPPTVEQRNYTYPPQTPIQTPTLASQEKLSCLLGGVCFILPIVGLILFLIERTNNPQKANAALGWGIAGFILVLIGYYMG